MTYSSMEASIYQGAPWEAYWFSWGTENRYYTGHDADVVIGLNTYTPEAIKCTGGEKDEEISSDTLTITIPLDHELALLFRPNLPPRPVSVVVKRGHVGDSDVVTAFSGVVKSSEVDGDECKLTIVNEHDSLSEELPGLVWQSGCFYQIFDEGCKLNKTNFFVNAVLATVNGVTLTSAAFAAKPDNYFKGGWIEVLGTCRSILSHTGSTIVLFDLVDGLKAGMNVTAYPGCMGTEEACASFNNMPNYFGCNDIPDTSPFGEGGIL